LSTEGDLEKKKLLIDVLTIELNSTIPWVSRKEIASWTAIAFYIAVILSSTGFLYNNFSEYESFSVPIILKISPWIVIMFSIIVALFIHAQFSAIYDKQIFTMIIRKNIYKIIDSDDISIYNLNFTDEKERSLPLFISDEYNSFRKSNKRPGVIENYYKLLKWVFFWLFRRLLKQEHSTTQKQEALLYSLILMFLSIFLGSVFYIVNCI
jgi:hypothetical protein